MEKSLEYKVHRFIHALASLIDGLIASITLGFYWPNLSFKWIAWSTVYFLRKKAKNINKSKI